MTGQSRNKHFKNIAIVGSNGFIGSNLVCLLQIPDVQLFLFGKGEESIFGDSILYRKLDVFNIIQTRAYFSDIDIVYYLASSSIPSSSWNNPISDVENNLIPFLKFMECICVLKIKKIVFLSSAGTIYGPTKEKITEDSFKLPFSPYGITKLSMEYFLNYFHKRYNINYDIYRVSNVYGEGQNTKKGIGIINTFIEKILINKKIEIFGDGENVRNYIYIKDVSNILISSLFLSPDSSDIINTASNDTLTINELVSIIKTVVPEEFETIYTPARLSDNSTIYIDNTKLLLKNPGFKFTAISDGIRNTYEYIKK